MLTAKQVSYLLFAGAIVGAISLKLGPVILAALFSYMTLHLVYSLVGPRVRRLYARPLSLMVFLVIAAGVSWTFYYFLTQTISTLPKIANTATPKVIEIAGRLGILLPFDNVNELRVIFMEAVKENAMAITRTSGLLTKGFFQILVGLFVAVIYFMTERAPEYKATMYDGLRREFNARVGSFLLSFEKVLGAQVVISAINTGVTACFLLWAEIPYVAFLIPSTFILGILPLIGNILSNSLIFATALTISLKLALASLIFLVVIHKLEYFLNSRIVGSSINAPMWQTLLGILVGETIMGVPGIIIAPAIWHYVREELQSVSAQKLEGT